MKKKLAFFLILLTLAVTLCGYTFDTENKFTSGDYTYVLDENGNAEITRHSGEDSYITIPDTLDSHPVVSIGSEAFPHHSDLIEVSIPDSVTAIEYGAFTGCSNLTKISIPDSVTSIGDLAFSQCQNLDVITIPESVTSIGANPFSMTPVSIYVSARNRVFSVVDDILIENAPRRLISYPYASKESEYTTPDDILEIGKSAFALSENLTKITVSDSVTFIDRAAFAGCRNLETLIIPDSVTYIGPYAISSYYNVTVYASPESYAAQYCAENGIPCQ